jgi:hypothetical protein
VTAAAAPQLAAKRRRSVRYRAKVAVERWSCGLVDEGADVEANAFRSMVVLVLRFYIFIAGPPRPDPCFLYRWTWAALLNRFLGHASGTFQHADCMPSENRITGLIRHPDNFKTWKGAGFLKGPASPCAREEGPPDGEVGRARRSR